ncbi:hypothetical protein CY34DRAFT_136170 [Suillus luteus UH-Slu-Lm8-n1]|uniref:Uncharacterized protein n=1 Tax=Suillus luteus UH-Slu-Lm8-n1 TaxID=930992 RepID=A0A0C9ZXY3_9AGAM|nr:hypothetical protein CY34DRAFT_136170 [Suillus luteus UH-Slu-Lm8-n1]
MTAKDKTAKSFSWHISPGRSVRSARSESSFAPQAKMPPRPTDTSTEEQSPIYSATWYFRGIRMTRPSFSPARHSSKFDCRRKALGSTGGVFDKRGGNAVQPRFYDVRTTRRLVGIRLCFVPVCLAQSYGAFCIFLLLLSC